MLSAFLFSMFPGQKIPLKQDLLAWHQALQWIPGWHHASFMGLSMVSRMQAKRFHQPPPSRVQRGNSPIARKGSSAQASIGKTSTASTEGAQLPGRSADQMQCPSPIRYFTSRHRVLSMILNLRKYCETNWVCRPSQQPSKAADCIESLTMCWSFPRGAIARVVWAFGLIQSKSTKPMRQSGTFTISCKIRLPSAAQLEERLTGGQSVS